MLSYPDHPTEKSNMPRVIVITEDRKPGGEESILLDELVHSIHLDTERLPRRALRARPPRTVSL